MWCLLVWELGGGKSRLLEWGSLGPCTEVRKRLCEKSLMNPWGVFQWVCESHQRSREPGLLPALLTLGSNRTRRRAFSALDLGEPASECPQHQRREPSSLWQLSLGPVEYTLNLSPAWCSLADCFVVLSVFPWVGPYMLFPTWDADSEREDSAWGLTYPKTTVLMLLGPIKTEEVKPLPVGNDVCLKSFDVALWIRIARWQRINSLIQWVVMPAL